MLRRDGQRETRPGPSCCLPTNFHARAEGTKPLYGFAHTRAECHPRSAGAPTTSIETKMERAYVSVSLLPPRCAAFARRFHVSIRFKRFYCQQRNECAHEACVRGAADAIATICVTVSITVCVTNDDDKLIRFIKIEIEYEQQRRRKMETYKAKISRIFISSRFSTPPRAPFACYSHAVNIWTQSNMLRPVEIG